MTGYASITDILSALKEVKPRGPKKWQALCPAHEDHNPSLSVSEGNDGKVLMHCHAGCEYGAIMKGLGLSVNGNGRSEKPHIDLHSSAKKPKLRIIATYDYLDENGNLLFQKVRFEPKTFRIRRQKAGGGFTQGLSGIEPVLYRLPELVESNNDWQPIFICEGEKDADRLTSLGLIATCNFDGAGKWRQEYNSYFSQRNVYILADNDKPGRKHAHNVAAHVCHEAKSVKVVNLPDLPEKEDVSDWLDMGHTKDELERICLLSPLWDSNEVKVNGNPNIYDKNVSTGELTLSSQPLPMCELLAHQFKPQEFLVEGLFAKGHVVVLGGRPKSGKSWLALQLVSCVDTGKEFLGRKTTQAKVLYYALEDGQRRVQTRAKTFGWQPNSAEVLFNISHLDDGRGGLGPGVMEIANYTEVYDLIVVDTLVTAMTGRTDERDNSAMGSLINALANVAHKTDKAIVIVHHTGKTANVDDIFSTLRGASAIRGGYDVGLILERKPSEREAILHVESRDLDIRNMTLRQADNGSGWDYVGDANELERIRAGRKVLGAMLEHDSEANGMTIKQLAEKRGVSEATIGRQLAALEESGYVHRDEQPSTQMGKLADIWRVKSEFLNTK